MKKNFLIYVCLAAVACACNTKEDDPIIGTLSGHYIGFGEVNVDPAVTKASGTLAISEPEVLMNSADFSLSGEVSVSPIGEEISTKAPVTDVPGQITRDNLSKFYVEGFLGGTRSDLIADGTQFIEGAEATYDPTATSTNRSITGRWFFTPKDAYQWRNRVNHYFWAYSDGASNVTATKDKLEFDFDTQDMTKDLVVAYHEQFWDGSHADETATPAAHDPQDELRVLDFKHAVAAVALNNGIEFRKLNKENPTAPVNGKYAESDLGPNTKDEDESTPRLELVHAGLQAFSKGHLKAEGGTFTWSGFDGYVKGATTPINGLSTYFMIPQLVNTTTDYNENAIAIFTIRDNKLTKTQDFPIHLPRITTGTAPEYWEAGKYYKYNFTGRFIAPFVPYGSADGYPANFAGQGDQLNIPFEPVDFTYIHTINIKWTNLGYCNSNGYHIYMIVSPRIIETHTGTYKDGTPITLINDGQTLINTNTDVVFFEQIEKNEVSTFVEHKAGVNYSMTIDGNPIQYGVNYSKAALESSFEITNIDVSSLTGKNYIYIIYQGGNNANSEWVLTDISFEIVN